MFQTMLDAIFASGLAVPATIARGTATPTACRVLLRTPDEPSAFFGAGANTTKRVAEVRVSEVASVDEGDRVVVASTTYTVQAASNPDPDRLVHRMELMP